MWHRYKFAAMTIHLRPIQPEDNQQIAAIIRATLEEFKANHPGTVYYDTTTDQLSDVFTFQASRYWIAMEGNQMLGGGGIFPTEGLPGDTCELVKLYLLPAARGKGIGKLLMEQCHAEAKALGFQKIYLETMPELTNAIPLYEKQGYTYLEGSLGNSGHFGCEVHMIKLL